MWIILREKKKRKCVKFSRIQMEAKEAIGLRLAFCRPVKPPLGLTHRPDTQEPRDNTISIDNDTNNRYTVGMKTAISIPDELFEELDKVSKEYRASRSHVITVAIGEYLDRMKSRKLLEDLNASLVSDSPEERKVRERGRRHYAGKVLKERY